MKRFVFTNIGLMLRTVSISLVRGKSTIRAGCFKGGWRKLTRMAEHKYSLNGWHAGCKEKDRAVGLAQYLMIANLAQALEVAYRPRKPAKKKKVKTKIKKKR